MPDVYATIADADVATQERLAGILELRAADGQQRAMLDSYLSEIDFPAGARVLEIGCGTGAVTRVLADWPAVSDAVGIDPSPVFISRARELAAAANVTFELGDGRSLRFADDDFDAVVVHTTLCHVPQPERVLAEASRILRPGGTLAVFDGDYATITVALGESDPLQACIETMKAAFINDPWLVRRLPTLLRSVGFRSPRFAKPRLHADVRSRVHADTCRPWRRHARVVGAHRPRRLPVTEGRGSAASRSRRVLRLHRVRELHLPKAPRLESDLCEMQAPLVRASGGARSCGGISTTT